MKIILGIWVCLVYIYASASAQTKYEPQPLSQVHYDDDEEPTYSPHQPKYRLEPVPQPYGKPHSDAKEPQTYSAVNSPYGQPLHHTQPYAQPLHHTQPYGYHIPKRSVEYSPHEGHHPKYASYYQLKDTAYPQPQVVYNRKPQYEQVAPVHPQPYDAKPSSIPSDHPEELQYSHDQEHSDHHQPSAAPEAPQTSPVKRDPKLPLYFTMYEKRVIQDPTDKYGKGPWRYLTYGHGITYGSKEPGKVFEKGYGYIRALGRDHCKLPEHLCPPRDEKPFDYEGRKEPYFGYRPH